MLTLGDTQVDKGMLSVNSFCPTSDEFIDLINSATRRLARRGDWFETVVPIFVCVYQGCIVWPRYVGQVRKLNICNRPVSVNNLWYSFLTGLHGDIGAGNGWSGWGGVGGWDGRAGYGGWMSGWRGAQLGLNNLGTSPVLQDAMGDGRTVRSYTRCNADLGKTTTIFGTDNNGQ